MAFDVFISHSLNDRAIAEATCAKLEAENINCWIAPRNICPGTDWAESIMIALESCRAMVLIFSSHSNASPQVKREVQAAFENGLTVMPFRIEDVQPNASLKYYIGPVHWLDAFSEPREPHIDKLTSLIKALLDTPAKTTKAGAEAGWKIPEQFLSCAQPGARLLLEPIEAAAESTRGIRLIARPEFKLGRSREEADFLTWFWPRSKDHDEMTRRLSRVHVIATLEGGKILIRDADSTNQSTFDGRPLHSGHNDQFDQRGTLVLGQQYVLDVTPCPSTLPEGLHIDNIRLWSGPTPSEPARRGCVRFTPANSEIALFDALWLFTDANFGAVRSNPLVLNLPGVMELEGRFHHYHGNFWIEAFDGATVRVGDYLLRPREIVPITDAHPVVIGGIPFRATVTA